MHNHSSHNHDHGHTHSHSHDYRGLEKQRLILALAVTGIMFLVEVAGGFISNSLALLSDAGHMFTHLIALGISFIAIKFAEREATDKMTFGFYRAEIMAAFINGITLFILTFWIAYEAYERFLAPAPVNSVQMFWIALFGLIVNIVTALILKDASHDDMNVRSAFLHMLGDTLSSVGVVLGAVAIYYKGWVIVDPLLSILLCIPIIIWSVSLIRESVDILLEAAPKDVNLEEMKSGVMAIEGVVHMHDIHVWTLTSGRHAMSAHVEVKDLYVSETTLIMKEIKDLLSHSFKIDHTTIQFECTGKCISSCN